MSEVTQTTPSRRPDQQAGQAEPVAAFGTTAPATVYIVCLAALAFASCAVPVAPTGGPPDREPPVIESIEPANGAVNVTSSVIRIAFNE